MREEQLWAASTSVAVLADSDGTVETRHCFSGLCFPTQTVVTNIVNSLPPCSSWKMGPEIPRLILSLHRSCRSRQR